MNITIETVLQSRVCPTCGCLYALTPEFIEERQKNHEVWYCPNGHQRHFPAGGSKEDQLQRDLAAARRRAEILEADVKRQREAREAAERQTSAAKGQVTKMRNRVGRGVCPCCNRTFGNLQRHMATQHPEFTDSVKGATTNG